MKRFFRRYATLWMLIGFCLLLGLFLSLRTGIFFTGRNLINILEANSFKLLLAIGMTFVIASGGIDLSVGSILSLSAIFTALCMKQTIPVWAAILVGLLSGTLMGLINGALIHLTGINAFIITLGTSFLYRGLALIVTRGTPVSKLPAAYRSFGGGDIFQVESGVYMALLVLLLSIPLLYKMRWGHYITTLGGNPAALRRCGVRTGAWRISTFAVMGFLAALAGIINMEMDAITAVILGGTPLHGGSAALAGTAVAVLLLGTIRNGLTLMSVSSYYQQFITGAILLCAVVTAEIRERRRSLH